MKNILILIFLLGFIGSCAQETDSNVSSIEAMKAVLAGTWCNQYDKKENLTIELDNHFVSDVCGVVGTYTVGENRSFVATVTTSNGGTNCMPVGTHPCTFELTNNDNALRMRCEIESNFYVTDFVRGICQ